MTRSPSQRVNALLTTIKAKTVSYDEVIQHLEIMANQFQKDEAGAYRGLRAINKYYGVELVSELLQKSNELTGR